MADRPAPMIGTPPYSSGVVVLAAGEGRRFGGVKQLAPVDGEPMIRRVARGVLGLGWPVALVTGAHAVQVEAAVTGLPLLIARNTTWASGMGSSLATGAACLLGHHPALSSMLICLGDQPLVRADDLRAMLERHQADPSSIVATRHQGAAGPPAVFPRDCFEALRTCAGAQGAQALLRQHEARVQWVAGADAMDVDTVDDLLVVAAQLQASAR